MQLKIRSLNLQGHTEDLESIGLHLARALKSAVERGHFPPVAVAVRSERADLIGLRDLGEAKLTVGYFLASLSRSRTADGPAEAVGLMGKFRTNPRSQGEPLDLALVFLECGDCRWWYWRALIDPTDGLIMSDSVIVSSAEEGDALPRSMGRWWSYGRRARMNVDLKRVAGRESAEGLADDDASSDLVH
jgi:hypothetical protein